MTYAEIIKAIDTIVNKPDCPLGRVKKLEVMSKNIAKMSPDIQANGTVVQDFMRQAGFIGK